MSSRTVGQPHLPVSAALLLSAPSRRLQWELTPVFPS